jgi:putative oxidoreductase
MKETTQRTGVAIIRIITGLLMLYHGLEIFDETKMNEYLKWDVINKLPVPELLVYLGKGIELIGGIFLILGFLTRVSALVTALNMFFICFYVGNGRFYYEDQHPFIFGLLCLVFFFYGGGKWSLDEMMKPVKKNIST